MFGLTSIATDNLVASYSSRFEKVPDGDGYRFIPDDYDDGVACSAVQRDAFVAEFTLFVKRRTRFQILWLIGLVVFAVALLIVGTFWYEWQPLIDLMERDDELFAAIGAALTVLPLIPAFRQGHRLYQKPIKDLCTQRVATGRRHSTLKILHRRLRGMSDTMVGLFILVPLVGFLISWLEINDRQRSAAALGGFGAMFILGCVMAVWKHRGK